MAGPQSLHPTQESPVLRQATIILLLVATMWFLHAVAPDQVSGLDPTAMLAFGFIVLASYTIGGLVEVLKFPHITGYLIAGLLVGPSIAHAIVSVFPDLPSPFNRGVLNEDVIDQLSLLDTLAVALIALNAGGELKLESLRRGMATITSILVSQFVSVMLLVTTFIVLISGALPWLQLPGIAALPSLPAAIAVGCMVAAIALATSPAATIAVINDSNARGTMSRTVLSTVVLKDVLVVLCFAVAQVFAAELLGAAAIEGGLFGYLAKHIGASIAVGLILGGITWLYLKWVGQELLLFIIGLIYTATYVSNEVGLDPVLIFLVAGFTVSNLPKHGERLIKSVEQLSLPVYVVFFTLAGAKLHLTDLRDVALFAGALFLVRLFAIWLGTRVGARLASSEPAIRDHGWMGFVSQAGVAISLAAILGNTFGATGRALETLIIGGVALNELMGPVFFKAGLGLAGEISSGRRSLAPSETHITVPAPQIEEDEEDETTKRLKAWPEIATSQNLWGEPPNTRSADLNARIQELGTDLQNLVREVSTGPLREFRNQSEKYLRDLRRDFLRHHRRLTVQARTEEETRETLATMLRTSQSELSAHWRGIVLGRSVTLGKSNWSPGTIVARIDSLTESLPEIIEAPYELHTYEVRETESFVRGLGRTWLRFLRSWAKAFGQPEPKRSIPLRTLVRYHLSGSAPARLESLAALFVEADRHLTARTKSIFEGIVSGYDELSLIALDPEVDIEELLIRQRREVEEELALALEEVRRIGRDGTQRTAAALATGFTAVKKDLPDFATVDLRSSQRRSSKVFANRIRAIETLTKELHSLRRANAAGYSMLAMELELLGLQARIRDAVEDHVNRLENMVRRRALAQAERVDDALAEALQHIEEELEGSYTGDELSVSLKRITDVSGKAISEAARVTSQLHAELSDETKIAPLLDTLIEACRTLTPRYRIISGQRQTGEWKLPALATEVEVPFREIVLTYIESKIAPRLMTTTRELAQNVQPLASSLQELERLVAFNVELATAELEVVHDETVPADMHELLREIVTGQFERSSENIQDYRERAEQWPDRIAQDMREAVLGTLDELRTDLAEGSFSRARLDAMRRAASGRRSVENVIAASTQRHRLRDRLGNLARFIFGETRIRAWRLRMGLDRAEPEQLLQAGAFAAQKVDAELPLVYRRLFAADTMEAGDVLTGRDEEIQRAESILSNDAKGRLRSIALIGIDGVGKTAVASAIVRSGRWKNVRRVTFDKPVTIEEVEEIFADNPEGQLVVVDGLHWMLSIEPNGFEPLRHFVSCVIAEGGKRRWLTHADILFWNFASTVAPLNDAFPEIINLNPLDMNGLQAAVMARHRLSGYGHSFDPAESDSLLERMIPKSAARLRRPYEHYFHELHNSTGGLVRDALRLWLGSIRQIEGGEVVHVGPVPACDYEKVKKLPDDILVNLYQIARQGWMNPAGQARLFRVDHSTARAHLSRLAHSGLLNENDDAYRIAVHLRGSLGRIFLERGWIK